MRKTSAFYMVDRLRQIVHHFLFIYGHKKRNRTISVRFLGYKLNITKNVKSTYPSRTGHLKTRYKSSIIL